MKKLLLTVIVTLLIPCGVGIAGPGSTPRETVRNFLIDLHSFKSAKFLEYICKNDQDAAKLMKLKLDTQRASFIDVYVRNGVPPRIARDSFDASTVKIEKENYSTFMNDGKNALITYEITYYLMAYEPNTGSFMPTSPSTDKIDEPGVALTKIHGKWYICPSIKKDKKIAKYINDKKQTDELREARAKEQEAQRQAAELEAAEKKAAEQRETEQREAQRQAAEQKAAEKKAAELREAEQKAADKRAAELREAEQRLAGQRVSAQSVADKQAIVKSATGAEIKSRNNASLRADLTHPSNSSSLFPPSIQRKGDRSNIMIFP